MKTTEIQEGTVLYRDLPENIPKTKKEVIPEEKSNLPSDTLELGLDANVAMEILQNTIYSDKYIWMQEIPSNAYDAVKRRESMDSKFKGRGKITISIDQENVFRIRDNGTGISRRVFKDVYRIYGRSDKRNTDLEVGMFGLGAKSPFAMVDSFQVKTVAIEDDKVYEAMVTKSGISFTVNGRPRDDEPFGTEIIITIPGYPRAYDMREKLTTITRFWDVPVEVTWARMNWDKENISQEDFNKTFETYISIDTDDFILYPWASDDAYYSKIYISHIPYQVNLEGEWEGSIIFLKNAHLLRLTANREQIQKDDKWRFFNELLEDEIKKKLKEALDKYFTDSFDVDNSGNELGYYIKAAHAIRYTNDTIKILSSYIRYGHYNTYNRRSGGNRSLANFDKENTFWIKYSAPGSSVAQATEALGNIWVIYLRNLNDETLIDWVKERFQNLKDTYPPVRNTGGGTGPRASFVLFTPASYHWNHDVKHHIDNIDDLPNELPILSSKDSRPTEFYNITKVTHEARVKNLIKSGYPIVNNEELQVKLRKLKVIPDIDGKEWSINQLRKKKVAKVNKYTHLPDSIFKIIKENRVIYIKEDHPLLRKFTIEYEQTITDNDVITSREILIKNPTIKQLSRYNDNNNAEIREVEND